ncbi:protein I'm not dead yet-like [Harpegnathos saltator]|uniref:protein I'm not dead yet-like n=1 Tax=Harpegnathos saltator TaxID=610380 RepID=UPI000DBEE5B0|nr:protein I'm not dead yet-like [Harpegnathos saltator]
MADAAGLDEIGTLKNFAIRPEDTKLRLTWRFVKTYRKIIFAVCWAIFPIPLIVIYDSLEIRCAYVVLLMAGYWVSECFPMAVTSLIPIVLFPSLGILDTIDTCTCYMNDTIMVFIGGLILAVAIEHCNLHMRIALGVVKMVGFSHAKLLGGLCAVTTLISMWVSNTAATAMMVPIIFAVLRELEQVLDQVFVKSFKYKSCRKSSNGLDGDLKFDLDLDLQGRTQRGVPDRNGPREAGRSGVSKLNIHRAIAMDGLFNDNNISSEIRPTRVTRAYMLAAAYCSTFGGTGTLVGTGTNLTFKGIYESIFPTAETISFTHWMIASFPQMVINSFLTWLYLRIAYLGYLRPRSKDAQLAAIGAEGEAITRQVIQEKYKDLGPLSFHESGVTVLFIMCVLLWIFRKPEFIVGWAELLTDVELKDSVPVIFVSILMFFIPKDPSFIHSFSRDPAKRPKSSSEGLMTWKIIETKMPWGLIFLLGGGFAISRGTVNSCLAKKVGESMLPLQHLPPIVILFLVCLLIGTITEFTSNVGIANITLPVIAQMCVVMKLHPMYLMVPATLMCSFSFRLPVGTPPNAIIATQGHIPTKWLITGGFAPAIYSLIVQVILFPTWGVYVFGISDFPEWAVPQMLNANNNSMLQWMMNIGSTRIEQDYTL